MNDFDWRLSNIVARKAAADQSARDAAEAESRRRAEQAAQKEAARGRWQQHCLPLIGRVALEVNYRLKDSGLALVIVDPPIDTPAISRLQLLLAVDGKETEERLVFNVNAFGHILFVQLVPQTAPSIEGHIDTFDEATLKGLVLGFLEHATALPRQARR